VKRLITRDKKEFMGNSDDILDKYAPEFSASPSATPGTERIPDIPSGWQTFLLALGLRQLS
jgi:hypothetical protein